MKNILILLVCLSFTSCKKEKDIEIEGSHCFNKRDSEWYMEKEYKNELMLVIKEEIGNNSMYYLRPSLSSNLINLQPCNLPEKYKNEDLALKVSGRRYNHPRMDFYAFPFEITKVEFSEP